MSTAYALTPESTSWRPRNPRVALLALKRRVPFDFLELDPVEQALLRTLNRQGTAEDLDRLLAHVGYSDTKYTLNEHLMAMVLAVGKLTETLNKVTGGPRQRGRPRKTEPYLPIANDWKIVLNWYLRWLFRQTLDSTDIRLKPELFYDPLDPALPWHNESDERNVRQESGRLPHVAKWPEWHSASPECREALRIKRRNGQPTNPPLTRYQLDAIRTDIAARASNFPQIPRQDAPQPRRAENHPENLPHSDNKRWVAAWRKRAQMNASEIIERLDRIEASTSRIELRQQMQGERDDYERARHEEDLDLIEDDSEMHRE